MSSKYPEHEKLSDTQLRLYLYLKSVGGDALITNMYKVIRADEPDRGVRAKAQMKVYLKRCEEDNEYFRRLQMYVGSHVSELNKKLNWYKVVPGTIKRTYTLVRRA
jgi:hypothetical protein